MTKSQYSIIKTLTDKRHEVLYTHHDQRLVVAEYQRLQAEYPHIDIQLIKETTEIVHHRAGKPPIGKRK